MSSNSTNTIDLSQYVSNLDENVYTIFNLPEEVIAVIFAYVSRSSASFRDNLAKLLADEELAVSDHHAHGARLVSQKASRFHEKWVVGYGHSSVAEHAIAHIGVEKISRLASAELELANSFNSFTEYSQRYQRPKRGEYYLPPELESDPQTKETYIRLNEEAYTVYEQLLTQLIPHLKSTLSQGEKESERAFQSRIEKIAFEDARYVLTLATQTSLGMTGNGRALRDTLVRLLTSPYPESQRLAHALEKEISQVIPTLLRHVKPNQYLHHSRQALAKREAAPTEQISGTTHQPSARFTELPDYETTLNKLMEQLLIHLGYSYEEAHTHSKSLTIGEKEERMQDALQHLQFFDNPMELFQHVHYQVEMKISEANWHQLLRHNRGARFTYGEPTTRFGYTIPPHIKEAGLTKLYSSFIEQATTIQQQLAQSHPLIAPYCVTNAHHRQITMTASMWEMYHLINLRTSPEAQWDIRIVFEELLSTWSNQHPILARYAKRRL
ncbi:FAD-dependent thymidylate synthase [Mechercharimyces sp. CAU 1602]|nr:FAD-dependent thymidylate synthase [Mechercharimyces sp. CAU 1602]